MKRRCVYHTEEKGKENESRPEFNRCGMTATCWSQSQVASQSLEPELLDTGKPKSVREGEGGAVGKSSIEPGSQEGKCCEGCLCHLWAHL